MWVEQGQYRERQTGLTLILTLTLTLILFGICILGRHFTRSAFLCWHCGPFSGTMPHLPVIRTSRSGCFAINLRNGTGTMPQIGRSLVFIAHIILTDVLASLHWLWAPEHIKFKLAVIVYRALHGTAPRYLANQLCYIADLKSTSVGNVQASQRLTVCPSRLVIIIILFVQITLV